MNLLKGAIVVPDLLNSYVAFSRNERLSSRVSVRYSHNACDILETAMIRDTHLINESRNEIKTWTNCVVRMPLRTVFGFMGRESTLNPPEIMILYVNRN